MKTKTKGIKYAMLIMRVLFTRRVLRKDITHAFYYSKQQDEIIRDMEGHDRPNPLYKGVEYTECRGIGSGWSNWPDARLLGIGTYADITIPRPKPHKTEEWLWMD